MKWTLSHSLKKRLIANDLPILNIGNFEIVAKYLTKFLGIFIDENVIWKYHTEPICNKTSKSIGIMYRSRNILSKRVMKQLYFSFIHSYFNYANIAWASINQSNLISLYRHQKHAIRIPYDKDRLAHSKPLLKHAKTLKLHEINLFHILSLIFKCKIRTIIFVFHNLYTLSEPPSKYSIRKDNLLPIPLNRAKFGQFSIHFRGSYLCNKILANKTFISNVQYYPLYKNRLKEVVFSLNDAALYF